MNSLCLTSSLIVPQKPHKSSNNYGKLNSFFHSSPPLGLLRKNIVTISCGGSSESLKDSTTKLSSISKSPINIHKSIPFEYSATATVSKSNPSIGIVQFLQGKTYFITGTTGFLGKALIEKILRTMPDICKIFVLVMAKTKEEAMNRLKNEIMESELFECLRQMHGKSYEAFMLSKLIPVVGNMSELGLGMDANSAREISEEIDIFINSAANTTLDERYDIALHTNTRGPSQLMSFAKQCKKLRIVLHVSTTYVNGEREGIIMEKPFHVGESLAMERVSTDVSPPILHPVLDVEAEMKLTSNLKMVSKDDKERTLKLKELGMKRAKSFGWRNTYEFTKAMGEMLINSTREEIPVVVLRPSVIQSTYKEPLPGWIQGNRTLDPLILSYGKGRLPGFFVEPEAVIDVIPIDMVVNAILAATAKHGIASKPGITVYHVGSSTVNPLLLRELFDFSRQHFVSSPFVDSLGKRVDVSEMKFFNVMEDFSSYIWRETAKQIINSEDLCSTSVGLLDAAITNLEESWRLERKCKKRVEYAMHLGIVYEPYMFSKGRFHNGNTHKLMEEMSKEEMESFGFDVRSVDWKDYLMNIHIPGLKKHVMKGRGMHK